MGRKRDCMLPVTVRRNSECGQERTCSSYTEHYVINLLCSFLQTSTRGSGLIAIWVYRIISTSVLVAP